MLILTRLPVQEILIDKGQISIKVLSVKGNQVRIGIQASRNIDVDRKEIYLKKLLNPEGKTQESSL